MKIYSLLFFDAPSLTRNIKPSCLFQGDIRAGMAYGLSEHAWTPYTRKILREEVASVCPDCSSVSQGMKV